MTDLKQKAREWAEREYDFPNNQIVAVDAYEAGARQALTLTVEERRLIADETNTLQSSVTKIVSALLKLRGLG